MPDISPYIWGSISSFASAVGVGHLTLVASLAVGSSVTNYYLASKGKLLTIKILDRALWITAGIIFMDVFFDIVTKSRFLFHI